MKIARLEGMKSTALAVSGYYGYLVSFPHAFAAAIGWSWYETGRRAPDAYFFRDAINANGTSNSATWYCLLGRIHSTT